MKTPFITRQNLVKIKKTIGSELAKIQNASYDDEEYFLCKDESERTEYKALFDLLNCKTIESDSYSKVLSLDHHDIGTFTETLSRRLFELFTTIGVSELYIISHLKLDFFGNKANKFRHLVQARNKLEKIVGQNTYKEAFSIDLNQLADFIDILFWIIRYDASAPEYIFLFDANETLRINLCKYGNIHLTEFKHEKLTEQLLNSLGWRIINGPEEDNFLT